VLRGIVDRPGKSWITGQQVIEPAEYEIRDAIEISESNPENNFDETPSRAIIASSA
jgi:hypothetical protein